MLRHASLLLFVFCSVAQGRSVALLINFGDEGGRLDDKFAADLERTREIYAKLGYDIVVVPPSQDMHAAVEKGFAQVGASDQLAIETMGHGVVDTPPKSLGARFPALTHAASNGLHDDRADVFHFHNGGLDTRNDFTAALASPNFAKATMASQFKHDVGAGDMAALITKYRADNRGTPVRVMLNECYSGHPARTLERLDGVQAYAESDDRVEAHIFADENKTSFDNFYLDQLDKASSQNPRPAAIDVFMRARKGWLAKSKSLRDHVEIPWSPLDTLANDWCADHPGTKLGALKLGETHARLKALTDDTLALEQLVTDDQTSRRRCQGTPRAADLNRAIGAVAQAEMDVLAQMQKLSAESSPLAKTLARGRECLGVGVANECSLNLNLLEASLPAAFGPPARGVGVKECLTPDPATLDACLKVARTLTPRAAYGTLVGVRDDLKYQLSECDRPEKREYYNYYANCYARFWSSADAKTQAHMDALEKQMYASIGASSSASSGASPSTVQ